MAEKKEKCIRCGKECHTFIEEGGKKYCCVACCKDVKEEKKKEEPVNACRFC